MAEKTSELQFEEAPHRIQKGYCRPEKAEKENPVQLEAAGSLFEGSGPQTVQKGDCRPEKAEKENLVQLEAAGSLFEGSGPLTVQKGGCRPETAQARIESLMLKLRACHAANSAKKPLDTVRCLFKSKLRGLFRHGTRPKQKSKKENTRSRASRFRLKLKDGVSHCIVCSKIELAAVPTGAATLLKPLQLERGAQRREAVQLEAAGSLFEGSGPLTVQKGAQRLD